MCFNASDPSARFRVAAFALAKRLANVRCGTQTLPVGFIDIGNHLVDLARLQPEIVPLSYAKFSNCAGRLGDLPGVFENSKNCTIKVQQLQSASSIIAGALSRTRRAWASPECNPVYCTSIEARLCIATMRSVAARFSPITAATAPELKGHATQQTLSNRRHCRNMSDEEWRQVSWLVSP